MLIHPVWIIIYLYYLLKIYHCLCSGVWNNTYKIFNYVVFKLFLERNRRSFIITYQREREREISICQMQYQICSSYKAAGYCSFTLLGFFHFSFTQIHNKPRRVHQNFLLLWRKFTGVSCSIAICKCFRDLL